MVAVMGSARRFQDFVTYDSDATHLPSAAFSSDENQLEATEYVCNTCGQGFSWHEQLEGHYVEAHLDMSNELKGEKQAGRSRAQTRRRTADGPSIS